MEKYDEIFEVEESSLAESDVEIERLYYRKPFSKEKTSKEKTNKDRMRETGGSREKSERLVNLVPVKSGSLATDPEVNVFNLDKREMEATIANLKERKTNVKL